MQTQDQTQKLAGQGAGENKPLPKLAKYFQAMVKVGASDLHLKPDVSPHVRIRSKIAAVQAGPLSSDDILDMIGEIITDDQRELFHQHGAVDIAYELPDSDRFRINVYLQRGKPAVAVRRVTRSIPSFEQLNLPSVMSSISNHHQGLVLLSGATGSGKSTTIASMIEHINATRACHIITLEDPIEYLYESKKALISQREVGIDVENFEMALKFLLREDPDVVLLGEMRDPETFQAALQVAETGHLVFATLHASGAAQTIGRLLDLFPSEMRPRIRSSLGFNLRAIICQKLLPSIKEGYERVPATEVMMMNPDVRALIIEGRDNELGDAMQSHEVEGMHTFTRSIYRLIEQGLVDPQVAFEVAPNPEALSMMLKGISASRSGLRS